RLVAHGLVGEAQWAQRPIISEDDSMLETRAPHETSGPERVRLAEQAEGAGRGEARVVRRAADPALRPDRGVVELDGDVEALLAGLGPGLRRPQRDHHGRGHAQWHGPARPGAERRYGTWPPPR